MLDLKWVRANPDAVRTALTNRNQTTKALDELVKLDIEWRKVKADADKFKGDRNKVSLEINEAKKKGTDVAPIIKKTGELSAKIKALDEVLANYESKMEDILLAVPNIPDSSVPLGKDENDNALVSKWGEPKKTSKDALPHYEIGEKTGALDFERGAKLAGHRFTVMRSWAAKLERAVLNFMLDTQSAKGYQETVVPHLVNKKTMTGTGQLPKFEEELYKCERDELYLIPTAEVPLTNLYSGEVLDETKLPIKLTAYTPCYRREAGAYGKDIKGMLRQHQFDKIELVKFALPEKSFDELESLTNDAENILQKLELPYQVKLLCTGDMGFSSAKTYDIEVWLPSQDKYREISSCSNCTDFQARRANIRIRRNGKMEFVHTLNGSGLAVGRTVIAIIENYQDKTGITVPKVLRDYMHTDRIEFK